MTAHYQFGGCFQVQLSEILDCWTFCYRRKAQNRAVSSSKVSFFTFTGSGRPILPHVYIAESFSLLFFEPCELLLTLFKTHLVVILCACRMGHL